MNGNPSGGGNDNGGLQVLIFVFFLILLTYVVSMAILWLMFLA